MTGLPRLSVRPEGAVTRRELAEALGYSPASLPTVLADHPEWPGPVGLIRQGRAWVMLYDLAAMLDAAVPAPRHTRFKTPTVSEADGAIRCLECGRRMRSLGKHLAAKHGMGAVEYRERHRLPSTAALAADSVREELSERMLSADTSHLERWQAKDYLDGIRDVEAQKATADYEVVRAHRLPGRRRAAQAMRKRRRDMLQEQVRVHGWDTIEDGIRATMTLPSRLAAQTLGISASSVLRWRGRVTPEDEADRRAVQ